MRYGGFVLVIEGCDKTGKSSLADIMSRMLRWPIVKFNQPRGDAMAEYAAALKEYPGPFIADRLHLGESVYGPIYRGTDPVPDFKFYGFERELLRRGAMLVLMTDSVDRVVQRFTDHGETFASPKHVADILDRFDEQYNRSVLTKIRMNFDLGTRYSKFAMINDLVEYAVEARR